MLGGTPNSSNFAFFQAWIFLFFIFPSLGVFFVLKHPTCFLDGDLVGLGLATSPSVISRDIIWWVFFWRGVGGREAQGPGDRVPGVLWLGPLPPPLGPGGAHTRGVGRGWWCRGGGDAHSWQAARTAGTRTAAQGRARRGRALGPRGAPAASPPERASRARFPSSGAAAAATSRAGRAAAPRPPGGRASSAPRTPGPRAPRPQAREARAELRPWGRGRARGPRQAPAPRRVSSGKGGGRGGERHILPDPDSHNTPGGRENGGKTGFSLLATSQCVLAT